MGKRADDFNQQIAEQSQTEKPNTELQNIELLISELDSLADTLDFRHKSGELYNGVGNLKRISEILTELNPEKINVEVHTDMRGHVENNIKLSKTIADRIKAMLVENNVESEKIMPFGFGETKPKENVTTAVGSYNINRRIEFNLEFKSE